jgi:predicted HTH domain antitoxin
LGCKGVGSEWRLAVARAEFLDLLLRHNVTPFQYAPEELAEELKGV